MLGVAFLLLRPLSGSAQNVQHLNAPQLGGMPGHPVLTGVVPWTNGVGVTWDGPAGYYQLFEKSALTDPTWRALGPRTNLIQTRLGSRRDAQGDVPVVRSRPALRGIAGVR